MKRSDELRIKRTEKINAMQALVDKAAGEKERSFTSDEQTAYDGFKAEVDELERKITAAEYLESRQAPDNNDTTQHQSRGNGPKIVKPAAPYSVGKAIREFMLSGAASLTGVEAEQHQELGRSISSTGLLVPYQRSASVNNTTTHATSIDVKIDPNLSIMGYEPLYTQMGLTILNNLSGTIKLGKKTHDVAGKYAESDEIVAESNVPTYVTLAPERFGITDSFTKELLAQENPAVQAAIVADMIKGVDRKITAEVYTVALAAASEVAAGALTQAGFDALMGALDNDGAFAMDRASFFSVKGVKLDAGSGLFIAKQGPINGVATSWDGVPIIYSNLFDDGAAKQYVLYGDWSELWLGFWGGLEILINPYTRARWGEIEMTVNRLADAVVRNTGAFKRSPDLDSAT